jgi:hypothetical protein
MSTRSKGHGDARRADVGGYASRHDSAACQVGQSHCVGVIEQGLRGHHVPPTTTTPTTALRRISLSLPASQLREVAGRRRDGLPCQEGMGMWQVIGRNASFWNRGVNVHDRCSGTATVYYLG